MTDSTTTSRAKPLADRLDAAMRDLLSGRPRNDGDLADLMHEAAERVRSDGEKVARMTTAARPWKAAAREFKAIKGRYPSADELVAVVRKHTSRDAG